MSGSQESESSFNDNINTKSRQRRRKLNDDDVVILAEITNNKNIEENNSKIDKNPSDSNDVINNSIIVNVHTDSTNNYLENEDERHKNGHTIHNVLNTRNSHSYRKKSVKNFPKRFELPDKWEHDKYNELEQISYIEDDYKLDKSPNHGNSRDRNKMSLYKNNQYDGDVNNLINKMKNVSLRNKYNNKNRWNDKSDENVLRNNIREYSLDKSPNESYDGNKITQIRVKALDVDEINARIQSSYLKSLKKREMKLNPTNNRSVKQQYNKSVNLQSQTYPNINNQQKYRNYKSNWKSNRYEYSQTYNYHPLNQNSNYYQSPYYFNSNNNNSNNDTNLSANYNNTSDQSNLYDYQDPVYSLDPYSMNQSYYSSYYPVQNDYSYYVAAQQYISNM